MSSTDIDNVIRSDTVFLAYENGFCVSCDLHVSRCEACGCDPVGGFNGTCHPQTGQCLCKPYVTGDKCDACVEGASHMNLNNYLGCSKGQNQYILEE